MKRYWWLILIVAILLILYFNKKSSNDEVLNSIQKIVPKNSGKFIITQVNAQDI
jgi:hypothetical protein